MGTNVDMSYVESVEQVGSREVPNTFFRSTNLAKFAGKLGGRSCATNSAAKHSIVGADQHTIASFGHSQRAN